MDKSQKLIQVSIKVNPQVEEAVWEFLLNYSPESVAAEGGPELPYQLKVFFTEIPSQFLTELNSFLLSLPEAGLDPGKFSTEVTELAAADWENAWKQFYQPLEVGENILILPSWWEVPSSTSKTVIRLDPGMAFGTGQHPSTRLCLALAEKYWRPGRVLDIGCGSGVLAIYAALRGEPEVLALDNDPLVLPIARENALLNQIDNVQWLAGTAAVLNSPQFELIFMNLTTEIILENLDDAMRLLATGGICLFSGILATDREKILPQLEKHLAILEIRPEAEWLGIAGRKIA